MKVTLTPNLENWVQERLASGMYESESELIREALRIMQRQEHYWKLQQDSLRRQIDEGIGELDQGRGRRFDASVVAEIKQAGRRRLERDDS
jgi:antitoxin ParD1/3/4